MSDVRALLKAKRQEARVNHPLASYSASGQLRCIACSTVVKHASSWEGHIGSKTHRTKVIKLRAEEQRRAERAEEEPETVQGKRKADESSPEPEQLVAENKKRRLDNPSSPPPQTAVKAANGFPTDFFSDPSHAPPPPDSDEEDAEGDDPPTSAPATAAQSAIDLEWEKFQETVLNPPDNHETYERATVFAEPVLASTLPEGFPPLQGEESAAEPEELTEEQKRRSKEQEERELIMDRLLEEERAQEEADAKVLMLKNRLEALRKQREAKKAAKKAQ